MKSFIFSLIFILSSLVGFSQKSFKAFSTEMYIYNPKNETWNLQNKFSDVDITIVLDGDFLNFQALTPTMYRLFPSTKESISTDNFTGTRFKAKELKEENIVTVDILKNNTSGKFLISVINTDYGYLLCYYIK